MARPLQPTAQPRSRPVRGSRGFTSVNIRNVAHKGRHQSSVLGWDADEALLRRAGATVTKVPGCCGLAGNFGVEKGHYEVSVAIAETHRDSGFTLRTVVSG